MTVLAVVGLLSAMALLALLPGCPLVVKRCGRVLVAFLLVSYLIRPAVVIWLNPSEAVHEPLSNGRIQFPTYVAGFERQLPLVAVGTLVFAVCLWVVARTQRRLIEGRKLRVQNSQIWVGIYIASWLPRLLVLLLDGGSSGANILVRLSLVGTLAMAMIVFSQGADRTQRGRILVYLTAGEALWSLAFASKTPVIAAALLLYVDPARRRLQLRQIVYVSILAMFALTLVQGVKTAQDAEVASDRSFVQSTAASMVRRFDLTNSIAGALYVGPASYLTPAEFSRQTFANLLPGDVLGGKVNVGAEWGRRITGSTSGTSVASGATAEGYVVLGWAGVVLENCIMAIALFVALSCLFCKSLFLRLMGGVLVTSTVFAERGVLGLSDQIGVAIQIAIVIGVGFILHTWWAKPLSHARSMGITNKDKLAVGPDRRLIDV